MQCIRQFVLLMSSHLLREITYNPSHSIPKGQGQKILKPSFHVAGNRLQQMICQQQRHCTVCWGFFHPNLCTRLCKRVSLCDWTFRVEWVSICFGVTNPMAINVLMYSFYFKWIKLSANVGFHNIIIFNKYSKSLTKKCNFNSSEKYYKKNNKYKNDKK